jgi:hypothetical protein
MVVIFGWGRGEADDLGEAVPIVCPRCHNEVFLHEIRSNKQVSLYFIPMASYGTDVYLACPICRAGAPVEGAHRPALDSMITATRSFRTGHLAPEAYRARAEAFLVSMGFTSPTVPGADPSLGDSARQEPQPAPPRAATLADRLAGLARLHADGVLTDDEFAAAKRRLLEA